MPFAKTGGLADVAGALPQELAKAGVEVVVFMPAYHGIQEAGVALTELSVELEIPVGDRIVCGRLLSGTLEDSKVRIYFVDMPSYFQRRGLYGENGADYEDNCERFVFFSRAVLESIRILDLAPDLIHANDWQTGLIPALLATEYASVPAYQSIASLITIHNLAYQGLFLHRDMWLTGLDWQYFNWRQMEFYGQLNLLKSGLVFADSINTVSPTYAMEIQTEEQGCGLEGVLRHRSEVLSGILNGIDTSVWNPAVDPHLPLKYDVSSWETGKQINKRELQSKLGLPEVDDVPLIGVIGRLAEQKGWKLILDVMESWGDANEDVQWVVLGTGHPVFEQALSGLADRFPERIAARLEFSNEWAHLIEAGSDIFLMPSQYEPCGLNQMYSMAYGTVPVVRRTGGLADTVVDVNDSTLVERSATGFCFEPFESVAMGDAIQRALDVYRHHPAAWKQLVETGMNRDWSWGASARQYQRLYEQTIERRQETVFELRKSGMRYSVQPPRTPG